MPPVKVRMYATIREAAGQSEVEVDAANLEDLIGRLGEMFGRSFSQLLTKGEGVVILINGRNANPGLGAAAPLRERDEVSIFPPVSGG